MINAVATYIDPINQISHDWLIPIEYICHLCRLGVSGVIVLVILYHRLYLYRTLQLIDQNKEDGTLCPHYDSANH